MHKTDSREVISITQREFKTPLNINGFRNNWRTSDVFANTPTHLYYGKWRKTEDILPCLKLG